MPSRKVDLRKILQPNDATAFIVILLGLFIALFLDEMAVRLIGVCIAILGGVALFMMISPRIADLSIEQSKRRRVSQPPDMSSDTTQDAAGVRIQFRPDEYKQSFGSDEEEQVSNFIDERQGLLFDELEGTMERPPQQHPAASSEDRPAPSDASRALIGKEIGDADSSVRIVNVVSRGKKAAPPPLVINTRGARGPAVSTEEIDDEDVELRPQQRPTPARPATPPAPRQAPPSTPAPTPRPLNEEPERAFVTGVEHPIGHITEETQLSEDVIVRPKKRPTEPTPEPKPEPVVEAAPEPTPVVEETSEPVIEEAPAPVVEETPVVEAVPDVQRARSIPVVMHDDVEDIELLDQTEPRKEFDALLNRVLQVIRSMVNARTAAFLWVNIDKQQLVVESKITDATDVFTSQRKLSLGDDVISQIAIHGRPEILTSIRPSAELDLLPYYTSHAGSVSFIGVPVYFGGSVVGVLCADSKEEDAYDAITVGFFGHFTKLISGLIQSYTGKYDLLQSARMLDAINAFRHAIRERGATQPGLVKSLMQASVQTMDIATIGVVLYDADRQAWAVNEARSVMDDYNDMRGAVVDLERSCVGRAISGAATVVDYGEMGMVRVASHEPLMSEYQLVAVPIMSFTNVYGALYIENAASVLTQQDIAVLETLGEHAGTFLEHIYTKDVVQSGAVLDESTNTLNRHGFQTRLAEEFARSVDYQSPFTLCLVQIDGHPAPSSSETENERILHHVLAHLRNELRAYDLVGRIDLGLLAIGLVSSRAQQAQIWAERMRREIASSIIELDGRRFTVTVSIGVAEADPQDSWETLLDHAYHVLRLSEDTGNKVTTFA